MALTIGLLILCVIAGYWNRIIQVNIYRYLKNRGYSFTTRLIAWFFPLSAVTLYWKETHKETGKTGQLFYQYVISFLITVCVLVIVIITQFTDGTGGIS